MASDNSRTPLKKRSVVSSFIYKFVNENGERKAKVALFKRSDKVRTYPHHWAVISGSIDPEDPSPLSAAWRELQEETTLTRSSLELMRQGKSYVLPDESIGREWTIHPFAFRLKEASEGGKGEKAITIDWEHEDWAWYDPLEVEDSEKFGGVPRLAESLRRVWFEKDLGPEAGAILTNGLEKLKRDQQSGARQLAAVALRILRDIIVKMDAQQPSDEWWTKVRFAAWHIWKNGRESMGAAILSVLLSALKSMEGTLRQHQGSSKPGEWRGAVIADLERLIAVRDTEATQMISNAFAKYLQDAFASQVGLNRPIRILTISESSTIATALRHVLANTDVLLDLRVLESRPLFEGVSLAASLINKGVRPGHTTADFSSSAIPRLDITLYTDASAALASKDVDVVLLGADRISDSGTVSNKTGSLSAVLSAKHVSPQSKTVIISESEKVAPPGAVAAHVVENNDSAQLVRTWKADFNTERVRAAAGTISKALGDSCTGPGDDGQSQHDSTVTGGYGDAQIEVPNIYFEWVPPELVDVYVTERGIMSVSDIRKHSETLGAEEERLFKEI